MRVRADTVTALFVKLESPGTVARMVLLMDTSTFMDRRAVTVNVSEPPLGSSGTVMLAPVPAGQVAPPLAAQSTVCITCPLLKVASSCTLRAASGPVLETVIE
jgi:hypothetical protein